MVKYWTIDEGLFREDMNLDVEYCQVSRVL